MAIRPFLAMTAAEMRDCTRLPPKVAWMACHFSPYSTGLSNLPRSLPAGALLILDDSDPMGDHDPERIGEQLSGCIKALDCSGLLLDFQRPGLDAQRALAEYLVQLLPCPVAVSEEYAEGLHSPVFLPPSPPSVPLGEYLKKRQDQEIWLDISPGGEIMKLTELGCEILPADTAPAAGFSDDTLHCHYCVKENEDGFQFTLWRTKEDLASLLEEAETLGVASTVGLYQEFATLPCSGDHWSPAPYNDPASAGDP